MFKRSALFVLVLLAALVVIGAVTAEDLGFGDPFADICASQGAPKIEQLNPPLGTAYFRSQFTNMDGDIVVVFFDMGSRFTGGRAIYPGSYKWCPEAEPR